MLASLDPKKLARVAFPLGEQDKDATRAEAERAGLAAARRPESQEACFLAGDDYRSFLGRQGLAATDGAIVDEDGNELGRHDGFWRFTPGQRQGLGLASPEPLYVLGSRPVGERRRRRPARVARPHERSRRAAVSTPTSTRVEAKLRYRSPAVAATVEPTPRGFRLRLDEPAYGVAPGQAAVLYDGDLVVGQGTITTRGVGSKDGCSSRHSPGKISGGSPSPSSCSPSASRSRGSSCGWPEPSTGFRR